MRWTIPVVASLALAACAPRVPDSGANTSYGAVMKQATGQADSGTTAGYENPNRPRGGAAPAGIDPVHSELEFDANGKPITIPKENRAAISDEQNFTAVKSRVSIAQDAARLKLMRQEYKVIAPKPLPRRPSNDGPNLVSYALSTSNPVGNRIYRRFNLFGKAAYERACARFTSADLAQMAFLRRGGPKRDPLGLDPDGDGYACSWDPSSLRHDSP
jgi:hypothetical protein